MTPAGVGRHRIYWKIDGSDMSPPPRRSDRQQPDSTLKFREDPRMKNLITDALIGLFAMEFGLVLLQGFRGYYHGLATGGPVPTYGWDGAFGTIALKLLVYGVPISVVGVLFGAAIGWVTR
jgi:hypothetical protein